MSSEPREEAEHEAAFPPAAAAAAAAAAASSPTAVGEKGSSRELEAWGQVLLLSEAETHAEQDAVGDVDPLELLPPPSPLSAAAAAAAAAGGEDTFRVPLLQGSSPITRQKGGKEEPTQDSLSPYHHHQQQQQQNLQQRQQQQQQDPQQQQEQQQGGSAKLLYGGQRLLSALGLRCLGALLRPLVLSASLLLPRPVPHFRLRRFLLFLGPGWLVAMAYVDPGNLEADLQAGGLRRKPTAAAAAAAGGGGVEGRDTSGEAGYEILWLLLWGHAVGWVFQVLAARLGNVTDRDLASLCGQEYGRPTCIVLWILAELAIFGADLQAVIGSAVGSAAAAPAAAAVDAPAAAVAASPSASAAALADTIAAAAAVGACLLVSLLRPAATAAASIFSSAVVAVVFAAAPAAAAAGALALQLLLGLPLWLGVCLTLIDCLSVMLFKGGGSQGLERFFGSLLLIMAVGFGVLVCFSRPSATALLRGLLLPSPPTSSQQALQLLSMLGCILMPHGLYLHSALVRSRAIPRDKAECVAEANFYFAIEAALALTVSFLSVSSLSTAAAAVTAAAVIAAVTAAAVAGVGLMEIVWAELSGGLCLRQSGCLLTSWLAAALAAAAGSAAGASVVPLFSACRRSPVMCCSVSCFGCRRKCVPAVSCDLLRFLLSLNVGLRRCLSLLVAFGSDLCRSAQNATLAGTYAGQFVMQGFLSLRCARSVRLLLTRLITIGPLLLLLLLKQETIDSLSEGVNLLQALLLPLALLPLLAFNCSSRVMGPFALTGWRRSAAFGLGLGIACINCSFVLLETFSAARSHMQQSILLLALCVYTAGLAAAAMRPVKGKYCLCFRDDQSQLALQQQLQICRGD
ncbi:hypothetical protein Emed_001814 [Eimeria media]